MDVRLRIFISEVHLDRWIERNAIHGSAIDEAGKRAGILVDLPGVVSVAAWAYAHGARLRTSVWVAGDTVEHLTQRWQTLLLATN